MPAGDIMACMSKKNAGSNVGGIIVVVVVAATLFGLIGFNVYSSMRAGSAGTDWSAREVALACTSDVATKFHIHPELRIVIGGKDEPIPSDVGVEPGCLRAIHTHDEIGIIHVEAPEPKDFTLSDFFAVWNKDFSRNSILGHRADDDHEVVLTVNGEPNDQFENLVLKDKDKIVIEYRRK